MNENNLDNLNVITVISGILVIASLVSALLSLIFSIIERNRKFKGMSKEFWEMKDRVEKNIKGD